MRFFTPMIGSFSLLAGSSTSMLVRIPCVWVADPIASDGSQSPTTAVIVIYVALFRTPTIVDGGKQQPSVYDSSHLSRVWSVNHYFTNMRSKT